MALSPDKDRARYANDPVRREAVKARAAAAQAMAWLRDPEGMRAYYRAYRAKARIAQAEAR